MYCSNCGAKLNENYTYCSNCGKKIKDNVQQYDNSNSINQQFELNPPKNDYTISNTNKSTNYKPLLFIIFLVVFVIGGVIFIGNKIEDKEDKEDKPETSLYDEFIVNNQKQYHILGYMNYLVPECWKYDEITAQKYEYKIDVFRFNDGYSMLDIKAFTAYDMFATEQTPIYDNIKKSVIDVYGFIKDERAMVINGNTWHVFVTDNYVNNGKKLYNEIYFTTSNLDTNLYYIEAYILDENNLQKSKYISESIKSIIKSATLYKIDQ